MLDLVDPSGTSGTGGGPVTRRERVARQIGRLYLAFAAMLVPWVVYLAVSLPKREVSDHYRGTWVGFDVALIIVLAWIGVCAWRRDPRIVLSASVGGALLCADAWFDVTTSARGSAHAQAILSAFLLELPCAALCFLLARRSLSALAARPGDVSTDGEAGAPDETASIRFAGSFRRPEDAPGSAGSAKVEQKASGEHR